MNKAILHEALKYLRKNTGIDIDFLEPCSRELSPFLEQLYRLYVMHSSVGQFLMIEHIGDELITPLKYEKHLARIMQSTPDFTSACVVFKALPFYVRQRYAMRGIAFIVPGTQLNWPQLGLALQQRSRAGRRVTQRDILPATQLFLLYALVHGINEPASVKVLSDKLPYSPMSISRIFDQLEARELATIERIGRERVVAINANKQEFWYRIRGYLDTPVSREVRVLQKRLEDAEWYLAGETALARHTALAEPREEIFAVSPGTWRKLKGDTEEIPIADESTCILQVWRYDPGILQTDGVVDPYSLWLSLKNTVDERVQIALDQLLDKDNEWTVSKPG